MADVGVIGCVLTDTCWFFVWGPIQRRSPSIEWGAGTGFFCTLQDSDRFGTFLEKASFVNLCNIVGTSLTLVTWWRFSLLLKVKEGDVDATALDASRLVFAGFYCTGFCVEASAGSPDTKSKWLGWHKNAMRRSRRKTQLLKMIKMILSVYLSV